MNHKISAVHDYTKLADDYDKTRYRGDFEETLDTLRCETFSKLLQPDHSMKIIDVGTGTGSGIMFFADKVKSMVGLDGTEAMLEKALEKMKHKGITNVTLVHADALNIPFNNGDFDHVISLNFIHLFASADISRQKEFVKEMERICKKTGFVLIEFDNKMYQSELGNSYSDLFRMSDTMKVDCILGTYMPKMRLFYLMSPCLARVYSKLGWLPFFKRFAYKWVVKYTKI